MGGISRSSLSLLIVSATATVVGVTLYSDISLHKLFVPCPAAVLSSSSSRFEYDAPENDNNNPSSSSSSLSTITTSSRLWQDMTTDEQETSLQRVGLLLQKYGKLFNSSSMVHLPWRKGNAANETLLTNHPSRVCAAFGTDLGAHYLCGPVPPQPCKFISFGINKDYSFDVDVANVWHCRGFAGDPTIVHPSRLHPMVTFHNLAASSHKAKNPNWWTTTVPSLVQFLELDYVDVLKMDCEGCEYALPRDVLLQDPTFFRRVGQISLEVHVSKNWINTNETLYYFGLLFELMEEAGLRLAWSHLTKCGRPHEILFGCMPQFEQWGFSCGLKGTVDHWWEEGNMRGSCHNFLFARPKSNRPKNTTTRYQRRRKRRSKRSAF